MKEIIERIGIVLGLAFAGAATYAVVSTLAHSYAAPPPKYFNHGPQDSRDTEETRTYE